MPSQVVEGFGGLNLTDDPGSVGWSGAIDLLNVDFDRAGRVRTRDGSESFATSLNGSPLHLAHNLRAPTADVIVGTGALSGVTVYALNADGTVAASATGSTATSYTSALLGTTTANYLYLRPNSGTATHRWDGTTWTSPAGMPNGRKIAVSPTDNRLVYGDIGSEGSKVHFSDAGAPETFGTNNYVHLEPGDGGIVSAMVTWDNSLFVFKSTGKFFVFYGNSTDSAGTPEFNYRAIDVGVSALGSNAVCATPDGVYFIWYDGIYRTTGGPPQRVGDELRPYFVGAASSFWQGGARREYSLLHQLVWAHSRLYALIHEDGFTRRVLVWDMATDAWTYWTLNNTQAIGLVPNASLGGGLSEMVLAYGKSGGVNRMLEGATTDAGTAIVSHYRSGFSDLNNGLEKEILETKLWGTGTPSFAWSSEYGSLDTAASVPLGTSPAIAHGRHSVSKLGENFSYQVSAASGAWTLNRLVPILARSGADQADRP